MADLCFQCGECCGRTFPMTLTGEELRLIQRHTKSYVGRHKIGRNRYLMSNGGKKTCPFLTNSVCSIYDVRPSQCRMFHCGRLKPKDEFIETLDGIRTVMEKDENYRINRMQMEDEGASFGNRHGWDWKKA